MELNTPPADPTVEDRANELARMIDGSDATDEVEAVANADSAIVSAYVETAELAEIESVAAGEGFEVGHTHDVGESGMAGADEMFVSFDYNV